jgi:voltage-gated potassium channel
MAGVKHHVKLVVECRDTTLGRVCDAAIMILIVVSIVDFSIETLPDLSSNARAVLRKIETVIVAVFTLEYALRVWVADQRAKFVFSFFGLIDLLAILPFYLALGLDLRSIRAFRILRLFKLIRYSRAIQRFARAFAIAKEELVLFAGVTLILLYLASVGVYYFERDAQPEAFASVFHSLWWAVVTLTTVGYGDVYPITVGGRVFTFFVLMTGLGVVAVPTGLVASALAAARREEDEARRLALEDADEAVIAVEQED